MNAQRVYEGLLARGLPPHLAAAFAGNIQQESNFDPRAWNKREGAYGLGQWRGPRLRALQLFAGSEWPNLDQQLDFIMHELGGTERKAWSAISSQPTVQGAAGAIDRLYERSAGTEARQRMQYAQQILNTFAGGEGADTLAGGLEIGLPRPQAPRRVDFLGGEGGAAVSGVGVGLPREARGTGGMTRPPLPPRRPVDPAVFDMQKDPAAWKRHRALHDMPERYLPPQPAGDQSRSSDLLDRLFKLLR